MSTTLKVNYPAGGGSSRTAITCTITSLTNSSARQSTVVDNTSNLYDDALVSITYKTASGSLGTNPAIYIYVYAIGDGGNYSDGASGSDGAYTMPTGSLPRLLAPPHAPSAAASSYTTPPASVANAFGGDMPSKWGVIVLNSTGLTLDASVGSVSFEPIAYTNN